MNCQEQQQLFEDWRENVLKVPRVDNERAEGRKKLLDSLSTDLPIFLSVHLNKTSSLIEF